MVAPSGEGDMLSFGNMLRCNNHRETPPDKPPASRIALRLQRNPPSPAPRQSDAPGTQSVAGTTATRHLAQRSRAFVSSARPALSPNNLTSPVKHRANHAGDIYWPPAGEAVNTSRGPVFAPFSAWLAWHSRPRSDATVTEPTLLGAKCSLLLDERRRVQACSTHAPHYEPFA